MEIDRNLTNMLHTWINVCMFWKLMSALVPQFQIKMQRKMRFTGIVTQGASRIGTAEFIKAFKLASSLDGKTFTVYRTEGERKDHVRRRYTASSSSSARINLVGITPHTLC